MKLNAIIVDDEPIAREILADYAADVDFLSLMGMAEDPVKALALINNSAIDLMFLDINMPKMSGLDFLRTSGSLPMTIITSAYAQYALDGFVLDVVDYLVKPISFERFLKACNKAKDLHLLKTQPGKSSVNYFFVKNNAVIEKVFYDELMYAEAMSNYVILHTTAKKIIAYLTMKGLLEDLPTNQFLRVHKSFIVNVDKVNSIEGNMLVVAGHQIPVGASMSDAVMKIILNGRFLKR